MAHKLFISYKYSDSNVLPLNDGFCELTTVRSYVDRLERYCSSTDHIYKAESDDADLSQYSEDTIWEKLRNRIFDSSVTIIMISAGMRDGCKSERSQWIPWEISFSLKETTRNDRTSHSNALLAVILPDWNGKYDYFRSPCYRCSKECSIIKTTNLFSIIQKNMFNNVNPEKLSCQYKQDVYAGEPSYIKPVLWKDFVKNPDMYIEKAIKIKENIASYDIQKGV